MSAQLQLHLTPDQERDAHFERHARDYVAKAFPSEEEQDKYVDRAESEGSEAGWKQWPKRASNPYTVGTKSYTAWQTLANSSFAWRQIHHDEGWHCNDVDNCTCPACRPQEGGAA